MIARGTRDDWLSWVDAGAELWFATGFVWPADRGWRIAYDTGSHLAGVGGSAEAIDRLLEDSVLTTVAQPARAGRPPAYE